mmetsp:Transcript_14023/g.16993  ORF Transcript_14023/g.16993 Transcript_14023/m.16993 type:complete len:91 (+) Transcript_14023:125-397(+)
MTGVAIFQAWMAILTINPVKKSTAIVSLTNQTMPHQLHGAINIDAAQFEQHRCCTVDYHDFSIICMGILLLPLATSPIPYKGSARCPTFG